MSKRISSEGISLIVREELFVEFKEQKPDEQEDSVNVIPRKMGIPGSPRNAHHKPIIGKKLRVREFEIQELYE